MKPPRHKRVKAGQMNTKTSVNTVRHWLMIIANSRTDSCYINGIRLFMKDWDKKTTVEIKRLCEQLKEVAVSDESFAIGVFGNGAALFFRILEINSINF